MGEGSEQTDIDLVHRNDENEHRDQVHVPNEPVKDESSQKALDSAEFPKFDDMPAFKIGVILVRQVCAQVGCLYSKSNVEETIVATSVSSIGAALDIKGSLTWISTSYLLTTTVAQPITGRIADAVGVKRFLIIELWIFVIGNIVAGTAKGLGQIIAGRLIAGLGGAGLLTLSCIVITQLTHERQRASYMNLINVVFIFADSLGPIVGGALANSGNWRWIFLLNAPFGPVITLILIFALRLPRTPSPIRTFRDVLTKVDLIGMFLLPHGTLPWSSDWLVLLELHSYMFWVAEKYAVMPVAPPRLFVKWEWRNVPISIVARTLLFFHIFATTFYLPILLQVSGVSTVVASALVIPFLIMAAISSTVCNESARLFSHVRLVYTGGLLLLPIGLGLMSTLNESSSLGKIAGYSLIAGAGFGSGTQLSMIIAQAGVPDDELSTVTALIGSAPTLGGTLGVAAIGTVINNIFRSKLFSSPAVSSYIALGNITVNANDAVHTVNLFPVGSAAREAAVKAYVFAWQRGIYSLLGIAGLEVVLCLLLSRVELSTGQKDPAAEKNHQGVEGDKADR
ncbi:hypothetical protein AAF712_012893 [Marasmius tenuissimus]|uniref:Major facilitator superfamily (MFS) profile domain-containing protein n=1 Tax=Marasmius tenuissimus TaxID=585030 RepID=A0ABR2ZIR2_9AGAR